MAARLFERLFKEDDWDTQLYPLIVSLKPDFLRFLNSSDTFYQSDSNEARCFITLLCNDAIHWYAGEGKSHQTYFEKLADLVAVAKRGWAQQSATSELSEALTAFQKVQDAEGKRAAMLEARLCESELNHLKLLSAECGALDLLNKNLEGRPFPVEIKEQFGIVLKAELQHVLLNHPSSELHRAKFWELWRRLMPVLGSIFSTDELEIDAQRLYSLIPPLLEELEQSLKLDISNPAAYEQLVDELSSHLMMAIQQQVIVCELFEAMPYPNGETNRNTRITPALQKISDSVAQGEWLVFKDEESRSIRCKLALKNPDTDQLLFVDRTGRKVMTKSRHDFALCFSTGICARLPIISVTAAIDAELEQAIIRAMDIQEQVILAQAALAQKAEQRELQQRKMALQAAQQQKLLADKQKADQLAARKMAAQKALAEARALAESNALRDQQKIQRQQQQREQQEAVAVANQDQASTLVGSLQVGAWLEILDEEDNPVRCKLSVIINSVGKYILVDNVGRKYAEFQRSDLVQNVALARVRVISNGENFDDQLVKVIRGLRRNV